MNRAPRFLAIVLLLLPVLYLGTYLALMERFVVTVTSGGRARTHIVVNYRIGGPALSAFYWSLKQIDQKLRPGAWSTDRNLTP